eukprot:Hpha_TRINITY_DN15451_c2_g6::TRINITY_DN15451_c2_g6_i1::g.174847::m.174847
MQEPRHRRVVICGAGHAAHAMTARLAERPGLEVSILATFGDEAARLRHALGPDGKITVTWPGGGQRSGRPALVTSDPGECIPEAEVVLLPLPAFAVRPVLAQIAPYLADGTVVGVLPGQGGVEWAAAAIFRQLCPDKRIVLFGTMPMPYNCRVSEFGKSVHIVGLKPHFHIGILPQAKQDETAQITRLVSFLFEVPVQCTSHYIGITLMPSNYCIHPARLYGLFAHRDNRPLDRNPLFYEEMDQRSADVIGGVSDDVQTVVHALQSYFPFLRLTDDVPPIGPRLVRTYGDQIRDKSSLRTVFATNEGYAGLHCPLTKEHGLDWVHRYFTEDVPMLEVLRKVGKLCGVATPTADKICGWARRYMDPLTYEIPYVPGSLHEVMQILPSFVPRHPKSLAGVVREIVSSHRTVLLDCDGVLWHGDVPVEGAAAAVRGLQRRGLRVIPVTNSSTSTRPQMRAKLLRHGIDVPVDDIVTASHATAVLLTSRFPQLRTVLVLGENPLAEELVAHGIGVKKLPDDFSPFRSEEYQRTFIDPSVEAVVVGFDRDLTHRKVTMAAQQLTQPASRLLVSTSRDTFDLVNSMPIPGPAGAVAALEGTSGLRCFTVGKNKETPRLLWEVLDLKYKLRPHECVMIGDRLDSDIAFARAGKGCKCVLVLSGVTRWQAAAEEADDLWVVPSLGDIGTGLETLDVATCPHSRL